MITTDPRSLLGYWCYKVAKMKIGQRLDVDVRDFMNIPSHHHNDATFTPADRILGNIIGSAFTHSYTVHPNGQTITFIRHENTGARHYVDPDRRFKMNDQSLINAIIYAMRRAPVVEDVPSEDGDFEVEIHDPESLLPFSKALLEELKGQQHGKP